GDLGGHGSLLAAGEAACSAPVGPDPPRAIDVVLDALAVRLPEGYEAAVPILGRGVQGILGTGRDAGKGRAGRWIPQASGRAGQLLALELWDDESWHAIADFQLQLARETGTLTLLQWARHVLARSYILAGDLAAATLVLDEDRL